MSLYYCAVTRQTNRYFEAYGLMNVIHIPKFLSAYSELPFIILIVTFYSSSIQTLPRPALFVSTIPSRSK